MSEEETQPPPPKAGSTPSSTLVIDDLLAESPPGIPYPETVKDGGPSVSEPPPKPPLISLRKDKPIITWGEVALIVAIGFLGNIALRTTLGGFSGMLASLLAVVLVGRRVTQREAFVPLGLVVLLAPWLMIRSSASLTGVTVLAIAVLLITAAGFSLRGSMFDAQVRQFVSHVSSTPFEWLYGSAMVQRLVRAAAAEQKVAPLLRGVVVAVPVLIVFTTLLASADEVFARFLLLDNLPSLVEHGFLTLVVAVPLLGLLSRAAHTTDETTNAWPNLRVLGPVEVLVILGSVVVLFGAFVLTQIAVAMGGADHVLQTEGLTQAQHARSGFFQLLWVAALSMGLVGAVRAGRVLDPEKGTDRFMPLALGTLGLTLAIAGISIQRVVLYIESFGMWQLRLWGLFGAITVALAIVVFVVSILGWRAEQSWFPGAMVVLLTALVMSLNITNPDAFIISYNLDNGKDVNTWSVSDDAVPELLAGVNAGLDTTELGLAEGLCYRQDRAAWYGFLEYNWAEVKADRLLDDFCDGGRPGVSGSWGNRNNRD